MGVSDISCQNPELLWEYLRENLELLRNLSNVYGTSFSPENTAANDSVTGQSSVSAQVLGVFCSNYAMFGYDMICKLGY